MGSPCSLVETCPERRPIGTALRLVGLMAGSVDPLSDNLPSALPHIKSGKPKAQAITSGERSDALPERVRTVSEAGGLLLKNYEASSWFGLLAPAGTPPDIVNRIQQETARALSLPVIKERILSRGTIPSGHTPAEFAKLIAGVKKKWAQAVKAPDAKADC